MSDRTMGARATGVDAPEGVTAVLAAMPEEVAALRAALVDRRALRRARPQIVLGRLGAAPVALCVTGDGARNAKLGVELLLSSVRVKQLLIVGVSGALSAQLELTQLVVAERVLGEGSRLALQPSAALVRGAIASGAVPGVVLSSRDLADSAAQKLRLLREADAHDSPAVVDLESATFAAAAAAAGIPWLVLRAVSDTSHEALPALLNRSRDAGGAVRRGRVLCELLLAPRALPTLLGLRARVARCADVLAQAASAVISSNQTAQLSVANSERDPSGTSIGARIPYLKRP